MEKDKENTSRGISRKKIILILSLIVVLIFLGVILTTIVSDGSIGDKPDNAKIDYIRLEEDGDNSRILGKISNPTNDTINKKVIVLVYNKVQEAEDLKKINEEFELAQTFNVSSNTSSYYISPIPDIYKIDNLSKNIKVAFVDKGRNPVEEDWKWYGPDSDRLNNMD